MEDKEFDDILLRYCNTVYNQNTINKWTKSYILPFPKKSDLEITKNYRVITFTSIAAKIYNARLFNRIDPKIEKILMKNQNGFRRNRSTTSQILTIHRILGGRAKKTRNYTPICRFLQDIWLHRERENRTNTSILWSAQGDHCNHNDAL